MAHGPPRMIPCNINDVSTWVPRWESIGVLVIYDNYWLDCTVVERAQHTHIQEKAVCTIQIDIIANEETIHPYDNMWNRNLHNTTTATNTDNKHMADTAALDVNGVSILNLKKMLINISWWQSVIRFWHSVTAQTNARIKTNHFTHV